MAKLTKFDLAEALKNGELIKAIPLAVELPVDVLWSMWEQMPKGTKSKAVIFAGAVALALLEIQKEKQ